MIYLCVTVLSSLVPNLGCSQAVGYANVLLYLVSPSTDSLELGSIICLVSLEIQNNFLYD